jgi:hypothetical protein
MRLGNAVALLALISFAAVDGIALYLVRHPRVSEEYRAYYISRTVEDWQPERYPATQQDGMWMAKVGLPEFVESTQGLSPRMPWGRWAESCGGSEIRIRLRNPVAIGPSCVVLTAQPGTQELGQRLDVTLGEQVREFRLVSPEFKEYALDFDSVRAAQLVTLRFPPHVPRSYTLMLGLRQRRVAISRFRMMEGRCDRIFPQ